MPKGKRNKNKVDLVLTELVLYAPISMTSKTKTKYGPKNEQQEKERGIWRNKQGVKW